MSSPSPKLEVLFTPADFTALRDRDLSGTTCVVFDVLRATTTIVTALANGAEAILPVGEISEAVALRRQNPQILLAGEREGLRITGSLSGGIEFDLGNSPREFAPERVHGRTIAITTSNGSRALRACARAKEIVVASFPNLKASADHLNSTKPGHVIIVCSGTGSRAAFEDVLGAGALTKLIWPEDGNQAADSAHMARAIYDTHAHDLAASMAHSRNGRRLLAMPELRDDVALCLTRNVISRTAIMTRNGEVRFL